MRFKYCPECGAPLGTRILGDEGRVPYCEVCGRPYFDMFSSCVITLVANESGEVLLLSQGYISNKYHNLVSGYISPGESAEEAAKREVFEETGVEISSLEFAGTYWFAKKDMLMIGFVARVHKQDFHLSQEVYRAVWVTPEQALTMVHPGRAISRLVLEAYLQSCGEGASGQEAGGKE